MRLPGQTDSWRLSLYGPRHASRYRRDTPSGLPAFPTTVGVNADDDLLPLAGARPRCRPIPPPTSASMPRRLVASQQPVEQSVEPRWWLRQQFHPIPNGRNIHFSGHGFIVGTVREKGQPDQPLVRRGCSSSARTPASWSPRPGRMPAALPIRTAGLGAAIHRGQLRPQADVPRGDRGQPSPGDDAVTVAITVGTQRGAAGGHLGLPRRRHQPGAPAFTAVRVPPPGDDARERDAGRDQDPHQARRHDCGGLSP